MWGYNTIYLYIYRFGKGVWRYFLMGIVIILIKKRILHLFSDIENNQNKARERHSRH